MKNLRDFINEGMYFESDSSKTITFDFTDLENAEETLDSLADREGCSVDGNKLTINVTDDNASKLDVVQDILQQYCNVIRNSTKRSSDEQYAQKTIAFEKKVRDFNETIEEILNPVEDE